MNDTSSDIEAEAKAKAWAIKELEQYRTTYHIDRELNEEPGHVQSSKDASNEDRLADEHDLRAKLAESLNAQGIKTSAPDTQEPQGDSASRRGDKIVDGILSDINRTENANVAAELKQAGELTQELKPLVARYDQEMGIEHKDAGTGKVDSDGGYIVPPGKAAADLGAPGFKVVLVENMSNYHPSNGVITLNLKDAQDSKLRDFLIAHEVAHQKTLNEKEADVMAARVIGPQQAIDALAEFGKLHPEQRSPDESLDPHGTVFERQQNIVDHFPDQHLVIRAGSQNKPLDLNSPTAAISAPELQSHYQEAATRSPNPLKASLDGIRVTLAAYYQPPADMPAYQSVGFGVAKGLKLVG